MYFVGKPCSCIKYESKEDNSCVFLCLQVCGVPGRPGGGDVRGPQAGGPVGAQQNQEGGRQGHT